MLRMFSRDQPIAHVQMLFNEWANIYKKRLQFSTKHIKIIVLHYFTFFGSDLLHFCQLNRKSVS